eukprot:TRINITY_DN20022_c0_g1_i1.p1 TRINITY_DN20022_c0_g1~~TRINITY_DN20022_c0_g1_i1.p1  ORF type:complete len:193 (-),score=48.87 TRINITY_DN20022_c0_g1_i1:140-718(-)
MSVSRRRSAIGRFLLVVSSLCALLSCFRSTLPGFVQGPSSRARAPSRGQILLQRASGSVTASSENEAKAVSAAAKDGTAQTKDIDDAVLRMAMAMAEDDEAKPKEAVEQQKEEEGFDFNILVSAFWIAIIIYSFGSSIIGVTQGRIQDRTGGDFTLYDFFDNIFVFSEWNLEYTLGFDPFKLFDSVKGAASK